jgi:hypothetical protein
MKKISEKIVNEEPEVLHPIEIAETEKEEMKEISSYTLVVKSPFSHYKKGDRICDSEKVNEILGGHQSHMVVKVTRKVG